MRASWHVEGEHGAVPRVVVSGDVDLAVEDALRLDLERFLDRGRPVRVDLRGVTFMDSAGLRSLMRLHLAHGAALQIDGVSEPVARLFAVAGIGHVLMGSAGGATRG